MSGSITLKDALDKIENGSSARIRSEGLDDLKHILRHDRATSTTSNIADPAFNHLYQTLFQLSRQEVASWHNAKASTTRTVAENKLTSCANALWLSVEVGVQRLKAKTVRACTEHLMQSLLLSNGDLCSPLALDYARALKTLYSFQTHVEHLNNAEWGHIATFCLKTARLAERSTNEDDGAASGTEQGSHGLSVRSSRSLLLRDTAGSQGNSSSLEKRVAKELLEALSLLASAPNAPISEKAPELVTGCISILQSSSLHTCHFPAFATIKRVLAWIRTEHVQLARKITPQLIRLVRTFWSQTRASASRDKESQGMQFKDDMIITLLYLRPYIAQSLQEDNGTFRAELSRLLDVLRTKYGGTVESSDKQTLRVEDLDLTFKAPDCHPSHRIGTLMFGLRSMNPRAEQHWAHLDLVAWLVKSLSLKSGSNDTSEVDSLEPQKKRQKTTVEWEDLVSSTLLGTVLSRESALQVLTFVSEHQTFSSSDLTKVLDALTTSCGDENPSIATWAFLAATSCAAHSTTVDKALSSQWNTICELALHSISNQSTCRASCYLLFVAIKLRLIPQTAVTDLLQSLTSSIDLRGPAVLADSSAQFLIHLVRTSQAVNPSQTSVLAESILRWTLRTVAPSNFEDRSHSLPASQCGIGDIVGLLCICLNQADPLPSSTGSYVWDKVGQAILACREQHETVSYLLLLTTEKTKSRLDYSRLSSTSGHGTVSQPRISCESAFLGHFIAEFHRTGETWNRIQRERPLGITADIFRSVFTVSCGIALVAHDLEFRDSKSQTQLCGEVDQLLQSLGQYISGTVCDDDKVDTALMTFSQACLEIPREHSVEHWMQSKGQKLLCRLIHKSLSARKGPRVPTADEDSDDMDIDSQFDSQSSRQSARSTELAETKNDSSMLYSRMALRACASLFAAVSSALADEEEEQNSEQPSARIVSQIVALSEPQFFASRSIIEALLSFGLTFSATETERLLDFCTNAVMEPYRYRRTEVALGTMLAVMSTVLRVWVDRRNVSVYELGVDLYNWFTSTALPANMLSPNVQMKLVSILLDVFRANTTFAKDQEGAPEIGASIFKIIEISPIQVNFLMARRISSIFGLFTRSEHGSLFDDIADSLPGDETHMEGMAIRLLFFSQLGSAWDSILRQCVYYIFETAGKVPMARQHATRCIMDLTDSLAFVTPRKLFRLFCPQLIYTWLETQQLNRLPFGSFDYASLDDLLEQNQVEIFAQVMAHTHEQDLAILTKACNASVAQLTESSFSRTMAYALSWDIDDSKPDGNVKRRETRIQEALGAKEALARLCHDQFPTIVGYLYLTVKLEKADSLDLRLKPEYAEADAAMREMKRYGHSVQGLPPNQQPSFRADLFLSRMTRLCKRINERPEAPWSTSRFALTARMLLDSVDRSLGALHVCLMLRRMRLLIATAGQVAVEGYPLEMLLRSIRPFLSLDECADDALGIIKYLLCHGEAQLKTNLRFTVGTILLMVLQMCQYVRQPQDKTTQESQRRGTMDRMHDFRIWLVDYLRRVREKPASEGGQISDRLLTALTDTQLPGNAIRGTPESYVLESILKQICCSKPLWSLSDSLEALTFLGKDFISAKSASQDFLGSSIEAAKHADSVFTVLSSDQWDKGFLQWQALVLGRAYAATGRRPQLVEPARSECALAPGTMSSQRSSEHRILQRLAGLIFSKNRSEAGLSDHVLRKVFDKLIMTNDVEEAEAFKSMLPYELAGAVQNGCQGYLTPMASDHATLIDEVLSIEEALAVSAGMDHEKWTKRLAIAICKNVPDFLLLLKSLPLALAAVPGLATAVLPQIVHMVLVEERDNGLRRPLSRSMMSHFRSRDEHLAQGQRLFIQIFLYLRTQPYPGEKVQTERLQWLDIDMLTAANAAASCGMATAALLFAESAPPVTFDGPRRSSSRASVSSQKLSPVQVPDGLLLSIFKQVDEPDSFYGVQQSASVESVLARLDYEQDGYRSLMFRSAQMDAAMRAEHRFVTGDSLGMIRSLSALNFNSLNYALMSGRIGESVDCGSEMLDTARNLQQWDLSAPQKSPLGSAACFTALQHLSRAADVASTKNQLRDILIDQVRPSNIPDSKARGIWCSTLATLAEIDKVVNISGEDELNNHWAEVLDHNGWMKMAAFEDCHTIVSNRQTLFSVLASNKFLSRALQTGVKACRLLEAKSLVELSQFSRSHTKLQEALSAANQLSLLSNRSHEVGLTIGAAAKMETALAFWHTGETTASVQMLRDVFEMNNIETESIPVGRSGLLAQLGRQLGDARLEKPEDIMHSCLEPAILHLQKRNEGIEAGKVFHEYASFCDRQLQNPAIVEELNRIEAMWKEKAAEKDGLEALYNKAKRNSGPQPELAQAYDRAKKWAKMDEDEYTRQKTTRDTFVKHSLQYYMSALQASDEHDISALRFFALWLDNAEVAAANEIVHEHLQGVPSWKFVRLLNQLMSRLEHVKSTFQDSLQHLVTRMCAEHPFHSLHHLFAGTRKTSSPSAILQSRIRAAAAIRQSLAKQPQSSDLLGRFFIGNNEYAKLAQLSNPSLPKKSNNKVSLNNFSSAASIVLGVLKLRLPPATINIQLKPDGNYNDVPILKHWRSTVSIMSGVSAPKAITAVASDGKEYKQLFKGGNDDLRQDAIMEQVFEEVSKMLSNHNETRRRNLHVRTYKVIPLSQTSGIIEFVPNSIPLNEFLQPAHRQYFPNDMDENDARNIINDCKSKTNDVRVKEFHKVCEQIHPVLRHFFFERFDDPDDWFQKRTAYTRTTAANSMMGYVIGLGDRHNSNILLDEKTGEAVHIDLGISFEAGKVLPIPETVPFRLTRDIVDAMGATKTEGVFRRCCEFTLNALRDDRDSIMTLLNVLRYDPLHSWTVSAARAKKMQNASETKHTNGTKVIDEHSSKRKEQEAADADRALAAVEKKLAKTLSTAATVNELIQQATDEQNLGLLFHGWAAFW